MLSQPSRRKLLSLATSPTTLRASFQAIGASGMGVALPKAAVLRGEKGNFSIEMTKDRALCGLGQQLPVTLLGDSLRCRDSARLVVIRAWKIYLSSPDCLAVFFPARRRVDTWKRVTEVTVTVLRYGMHALSLAAEQTSLGPKLPCPGRTEV